MPTSFMTMIGLLPCVLCMGFSTIWKCAIAVDMEIGIMRGRTRPSLAVRTPRDPVWAPDWGHFTSAGVSCCDAFPLRIVYAVRRNLTLLGAGYGTWIQVKQVCVHGREVLMFVSYKAQGFSDPFLRFLFKHFDVSYYHSHLRPCCLT